MTSIIECNGGECEICYNDKVNSNIYCNICHKNMCLSCLINVKKCMGIDENIKSIVYCFKCPFCRSQNELDVLKTNDAPFIKQTFYKTVDFLEDANRRFKSTETKYQEQCETVSNLQKVLIDMDEKNKSLKQEIENTKQEYEGIMKNKNGKKSVLQNKYDHILQIRDIIIQQRDAEYRDSREIKGKYQELENKYQELENKYNEMKNVISNAVKKGRKTVTINDLYRND